MIRILLIDDDADFSDLLREELSGRGCEVAWEESAEASRPLLEAPGWGGFDVVLLDNKLPHDNAGIEFLEALRNRGVQIPVILITGHGSADVLAHLLIDVYRLGARDVFPKPLELAGAPLEKLLRLVRDAAATARLIKERVRLPEDEDTTGTPLLGTSAPMRQVYNLIGGAARSPGRHSRVHITGEPGTGKTLVARALFHHSERRDKLLLPVKCAASHEKELEEELFGYEDADQQKIGVLEKAHGGAILLDELQALSPFVQARLEKVLHAGIAACGGSGRLFPVDVWVIGCAHEDSDFGRRSERQIRMPPLRERGEDVVLLAEHFLAQSAPAEGSPCVPALHPQAARSLRGYPWPGNVRELRQVIRTAVRLCNGSQVTVADLKLDPDKARTEGGVGAHLRSAIRTASQVNPAELYPFLQEILRRELVVCAWTELGGDVQEIARRTGLRKETILAVLNDFLGDHKQKKAPAPSRWKAHEEYKWALGQDPALADRPLAEVYRWLVDKKAREGETFPHTGETFARYVREVEAFLEDRPDAP